LKTWRGNKARRDLDFAQDDRALSFAISSSNNESPPAACLRASPFGLYGQEARSTGPDDKIGQVYSVFDPKRERAAILRNDWFWPILLQKSVE
jgi:hypothetical protein